VLPPIPEAPPAEATYRFIPQMPLPVERASGAAVRLDDDCKDLYDRYLPGKPAAPSAPAAGSAAEPPASPDAPGAVAGPRPPRLEATLRLVVYAFGRLLPPKLDADEREMLAEVWRWQVSENAGLFWTLFWLAAPRVVMQPWAIQLWGKLVSWLKSPEPAAPALPAPVPRAPAAPPAPPPRPETRSVPSAPPAPPRRDPGEARAAWDELESRDKAEVAS
jgi:hypothetical protein